MEALVFGAGSLGSLVGGLLAREHDVTLVGRDPHVTAIRASGLCVTGAVDTTVDPEALTELPPAFEADLGIVTVKSFDTGDAARELAACELDAVLSLQNGMGNEETLAARLEPPVLAGTTTYGARMEAPGVVACTGIGEVVLGPHADAPHELADSVGEAFREAGIETVVTDEMESRLWRKLAVNAGINPVTALARVDNGALLSDPPGAIAERAAVETAGVAREHGIDFDDGEAREAIRDVADATAANVSSMRADVKRHSRTEIDAINGYVVERADGDVPVNETLVGLIRAWEHGHGLRSER